MDNATLTITVGDLWRHTERDTTYKILLVDRFRPRDGRDGVNGVRLTSPSGKVRGVLQTPEPIRPGTPVVAYVSTRDLSGKAWVVPVKYFTGFVRVEPATRV